MKRFYYITALALLLSNLCACGGSTNADNTNTEQTGNFSNEMSIESSDNFSTEMIIEASTEVTIIEME